MVAEKTAKMSENRRSNKPIMEKRRRARINSCLNDLKVLILEALKKDPARHSKLEKADILEMTVKHLQSLHRQQLALSTAADPNVANKFRAGFKECATEVTRFLSRTEGLDTGVRDRLVNHLSNCVDGGRVGGGVYAPHPHEATAATLQSVNMNTMMTTNYSPPVLNSASTFTNRRLEERSNITTTTNATSMGSSSSRMTNRLQLYPTRLPNGDFALLLPGNYSLAPYTNNNTSQENFLVNNNGTMSTTEMTVNSNVQSMSSPIPIETPPSIPLNLQSSLSSLHSRFQHSGHPYGGSLRNIPSSTSAIFSGQERELRLGNDQPYYILDEKVKDECQEFTNPDELSSCKDSLVKNDPWRPW